MSCQTKPATCHSHRKLAYLGTIHSLMNPSGPDALSHPTAAILLNFSQEGCPAKTGNDWNLELPDEAVRHGAHPSARNPVAAAATLVFETIREVVEAFAKIIPWKVLRDHLPSKLKVSHIVAIPHKELPLLNDPRPLLRIQAEES